MEYYEYDIVRSNVDNNDTYFLKSELDDVLITIKSAASSLEEKKVALELLKGTWAIWFKHAFGSRCQYKKKRIRT